MFAIKVMFALYNIGFATLALRCKFDFLLWPSSPRNSDDGFGRFALLCESIAAGAAPFALKLLQARKNHCSRTRLPHLGIEHGVIQVRFGPFQS
jgi:hypothetical protein